MSEATDVAEQVKVETVATTALTHQSELLLPNYSKLSNLQVYKRLLSYAFVYWYAFLAAIVGFLVFAVTQPLSVVLLENIVNVLGQPRSIMHDLLPLGIVGIFLVRGIGTLVSTYGMAYVSRNVVHNIRVEMFNKIISMPSEFFVSNPPGHLVSKLTFNIERVTTACGNAITVLIRESLTVLGLFAYLLYQNWKLTLIFIVILPPISVVVQYASKRFRKLGVSIQNSMGDVTQVSSEVFNANQEVKIYGASQYENDRFFKISKNNYRQSMKLALTNAVNTPVVQLMVAIALGLIVWLALHPVYMGEINAGQFVGYITAAASMDKPIRQLTRINSAVQVGIAAAHSIFALLDADPEDDCGEAVLEKCNGELEFKNVSFAYEGASKNAINNLSFKVSAGQTVALVGRSGSGKSSLASLVSRFYDPQSGEVLIDGINIKDLSLGSLRQQIAVVNQKVTLFDESVYHNIAYGDLDRADAEKVSSAARHAFADEFINKLDQKMDTKIGLDGGRLSGGQRQRIAIARAMLKNAPIMILDEATSALDTESERFIKSALESIMKDKTTVVIAHRLSTIENADRILVIDEGSIVESGTHESLINENGFYSKLQKTESYV